jgi:hypothetical protein
LVQHDWLTLDLQRSFAAVVGDKVFDNVAYEDWRAFKDVILTHLHPKGALIIRVAPQDGTLIGRSFEDLFRNWVSRYSRGEVSLKDAASGLWEQALGATARTVPGRQCLSLFRHDVELMERHLPRLPTRHARLLRAFSPLFWRSVTFEWTSYTLGNVIDVLAGDLSLTRIARSTDYAAGSRQPILEFRRW